MGASTGSPLGLSRSQILAFRRQIGSLDERLPRSSRSLRRAAWAGLQDSMPRAALLSIHARVQGAHPSSWEDPSLVQVWGPRFSTYVVPARDYAVFTLGRLADEGRSRQRAEEIATRLHAFLDGRRMGDGEAGRALGVNSNLFRYAAPTGTVLIRWDGARQATIWTVPRPEVDPHEARRELARRYVHVFGPTTPAAFATWAGIGPAEAAAAFERAEAILDGRTDADRRRVDPEPRRGGVPRSRQTCGGGTAPAQRRRLLPPPGSRSRAAGPRCGTSRPALDVTRLAGRRARGRRNRGHVAASAGESDDHAMA